MTSDPALHDVGVDEADIGTLGQYRRERLRVATKSLKNAWIAYARDNAALGALAFVLLVACLAILAPWISPHDPDEAVTIRHAPVLTEGLILGADGDGRDILSRLFWGGRIALLVGIAPTPARRCSSAWCWESLRVTWAAGWISSSCGSSISSSRFRWCSSRSRSPACSSPA